MLHVSNTVAPLVQVPAAVKPRGDTPEPLTVASKPPATAPLHIETLDHYTAWRKDKFMNIQAPKNFTVELEITRSVTVVIEASNAAEARDKASNLNFRHEITGEIVHWVVLNVSEGTDVQSDFY